MQLYDRPPEYETATRPAQLWRWGPGKSGPRLLQDLAGHMIGSDRLIRFPSSLVEDPLDGERHSWIIDLAHGEEFGDARVLRACCELTRIHVELMMEYESADQSNISRHCQASDRLHHFQLISDETVRQAGRYDAFCWACSRCPATLSAKLRAPEIPEQQLQSLYNVRPQSSFARPNSKQDENRPSRFSTLCGLEYLLRTTANSNPENAVDVEPREIQYASGTMFEKRVGHEREIVDMMKTLMFTFCPADHQSGEYIDEEMAMDEIENDGVEWVFRPANPILPGIRTKYKRLRLEMQILATKAHEDLGDIHRGRNWLVNHTRAEKFMLQLLDSPEKLYALPQGVVSVDENSAEELCYHKLGTISSFNDSSLLDFYSLQAKHDEPQTSYYLSALEAVGKRRNSLAVLTECQRQKSMGAYTRADVRQAYASLLSDQDGTIDLDSESLYTEEDDETLINIAASLSMDNSLKKQSIRNSLEILGKERDSHEIRKYLNTPERDFLDEAAALRYLGAEEETDDDFLITLYDLKSEENSLLARSALEAIADDRKNVRLRRFLDTGDRSIVPSVSFTMPDQADAEMLDPDLAYSRLGVDDRQTDDDMLIMLYEIRVADDPDEATGLKKALELLGDVRNSQVIKSFIQTGSKEVVTYTPPEASSERPVGLENIGNTCYLNSLLQYYFTIQPLRQAILESNGLMEADLSDEKLKLKKVGGRLVKQDEVERAIRFFDELRKLFRSLISSKQASLRPSRAVCFLALVSQKDEGAKNTSTVLSSTVGPTSQLNKNEGLSLQSSDSNQMMLLGPQPDATDFVGATIEESPDMSACSPKRKASISWVDVNYERPHAKQPSPDLMDLDNDLATSLSRSVSLPSATSANPPSSSPNTADQAIDCDWTDLVDAPRQPDDASTSKAGQESDSAAVSTTIDLIDLPPLPARDVERRRQSSLLWSGNDWGRQQDVAECIDNVLFQLEAALKPTGHDEDGEQCDLVKDLFYGETRQTLSTPDNKPKLERFSNTIVSLEADGQDIYQALDGVFDAREVELGGQQVKLNLTIAKAPPILQVQIQRVGFDLATMSAIKSNIYIALDQSIYLDRYLDTESPKMLQKRHDYWAWKRELQTVSERKLELDNLIAAAEIAGPHHSDHIWSATENEVNSSDDEVEHIHIENVDPEVARIAEIRRGSVREVPLESVDTPITDHNATRLELERELRVTESKERELSTQIQHLFDDDRAHEYRLQAVFIHRGEASHGHYWVYLYDFTLDKWRKYNDEEVTDVSREEVFRDRKGSNENPYMLSYVRSDRLHYTAALERDLGKTWEEDSLL